ncbi:MAG: hypothetical protein IPF81_05610 [Bacteroidetes bacterium]|nr:hypothetical protein [Bacteroidota bacterium]MBP6402975.1 hypothetical protein [Bacteroidia bacterium]
MIKNIFIAISLLLVVPAFAQQVKDPEELGDKEYIIVKDYKPVLAESYKISDVPEGDTTTVNPPVMKYKAVSKKVETNYETSTIKAVKVTDEKLPKLYRNLVKLGIGNYTTYNGEAYINSLRSKKGALGLAVRHFSGSPSLNGAGEADFSQNKAVLSGKYFLENATFYGDLGYDRNVVHFYGYDSNDSIIDKKNTKQRFSEFAFNAGIASNYLSKGHLDYGVHFGYTTFNDLFEVTENDFVVDGKVGKQLDNFYLKVDAGFNYFKKTDAEYEVLSINSNLNRNIIRVSPTFNFDKENIHLALGGRLEVEKNLGSDVHLFPRIDFSLPIAEHILSVFANVDGNISKNSFRTIVYDNPFITSSIRPFNTINKLMLTGGLKGNFSSTVSFTAWVKYSKVDDLLMYVNDSTYFNKFNLLRDDGSILNLHLEIGFMSDEKINLSLHLDQNSYKLDQYEKAWHLPSTIVSFVAKYNLRDKILVNATLLAHGITYAPIQVGTGYKPEKIKAYLDGNLGLEYRYSKILSVFVNLNNLSFTKYDRWYRYPTEGFNVLGGIAYSF